MSKKESSLKFELTKGNPIITEKANQKTAKQYIAHIDRFCQWAAEQGIKRRSQLLRKYGDMETAVQAWGDYLTENYAASTVHTYLSGVCYAAEISLARIQKPKRITSENVKSRSDNGRNRQGEQEAASGRFDSLIAFQKRVGIRRDELARLTTDDFVIDESGIPCIFVRKGKGGKRQLQALLPSDVETIRAYFTDRQPGERLFSPEIMQNHIDLHILRKSHAKTCYQYYASLGDADRQILRDRLILRYKAYAKNPRKVNVWISQLDRDKGRYRLRGKSADYARQHDLPLEYDRLALMCVSVFHLSHWRFDVTANNYMNV